MRNLFYRTNSSLFNKILVPITGDVMNIVPLSKYHKIISQQNKRHFNSQLCYDYVTKRTRNLTKNRFLFSNQG